MPRRKVSTGPRKENVRKQVTFIHFIAKKHPLSINDTKKSNFNNPLQHYGRNPFKNERHKKNQIQTIHFNFI